MHIYIYIYVCAHRLQHTRSYNAACIIFLNAPPLPPLDFYNPKRGCAQTFIFVDPSTGHAYPSVDRGCANLVIRACFGWARVPKR